MSRLRGLWFDSRHLTAGAPALHAEIAALAAAERDEVLATGDRLAEVSLTLAQQYCRRAPAALRAGAACFRGWVTRGERLARPDAGSRAAAAAYFALDPEALATVPDADLELWIALAERVLASSRRLGEVFVAESGAVLADLEHRPERLRRWVDEGLALVRKDSWEAELLALHFFEATGLVVPLFAAGDYGTWADVARAVERLGSARSELFASVPAAAHALPEHDRGAALRVAHAATPAPVVALELYFSLPTALEPLTPAERDSLIRTLTPVAVGAASSLRELLPVLRVILETTPAELRTDVLILAEAVAARFPAGAVAFFRVLPRLLERTTLAGIARWVERGLEIAEESTSAGSAYFELDSRTSRAVLATESTAVELVEVEGLARRYLHMLTASTWHVGGDPAVAYRPPFSDAPDADDGRPRAALFPLRIDVFPTAEANLRLFRLIAAQHAGRSQLGTDAMTPPVGALLASFDHPEIATELLALFEGIRVDAGLARAYRGLAADLRAVAADCVRGTVRLPGTIEHFTHVLRHARRGDVAARLPALAERLSAPDATVDDSVAATRALYDEILRGDFVRLSSVDPAGFAEMLADSEIIDARLELDGDGASLGGEPSARTDGDAAPIDERPEGLTLDDETDDTGGGAPLDPAELLKLLKEGAAISIKQGAGGQDVEALGLYISDLAGKLPRERMQELKAHLRQAHGGSTPRLAPGGAGDGTFVYDEWDHTIGDYRHAWCRVAEVALASDTGEFFQQTLATHTELLPEVRRQFQQIRPERYRIVHGLEDGEDFDLNAVIDARADRRAGCTPSSKLYQARQREERDVATLFLIDMSASTDEPAPEAPERRVIDITKEALVVMTEALEEIGDAYGIYGFSGHGRHQVELYVVKHFSETLSAAVKGRVGAIEPKRSTRMGTALRHAVARLRTVGARSRHIILLSDGFPQDLDYGDDRRSNVYGIQDTMMAFQEAIRSGVMPFCITVDKAGHDYLKDICDPSRYLVIEDITALPRELPKIYQRFVKP
jgi:hypothetical protein